jgi:putative ABC transport system permease protein
MFRHDWRQQFLVLALVTMAVAATVLGAAVATNTAPPSAAGFGAAGHLVTFSGDPTRLTADVAAVRQQFGTVDVVESRSLVTGTVREAQLRAQDPAGAYGGPMLALLSGRYPAGPDEVAMTPGLATVYDLSVGASWADAGHGYRLVGLVENPENLLDAFALVAPGQLRDPERATVLFDATPAQLAAFAVPGGAVVQSPPTSSGLDPAVVVLVVAVFGLVFVGLVAVAGFSVLAHRRLRALAALAALGATDRNIALVLVADGAVVGVTAALTGAAMGFAGWIAYRPHLQASTHHRIGWAHLPWWLIVTALVLAVLTSVLAARRPARQAARTSVVAALSGRPEAPRPVHRSAVPGAVLLATGLVLLAFSGGWGTPFPRDTYFKAGGVLAIAAGLLLFAPACITMLGGVGRRMPVAVRIALRDLARYRARSGPALAAISFAVLVAVLVSLIATGRYADPLDYFGPNLPANQLVVYAPGSGPGQPGQGQPGQGQPGKGAGKATEAASTHDPAPVVSAIANSLDGADVLPLATTDAALIEVTDRGMFGYPGITYVATPAVLRHYGIDPATVDPAALLVTSRSGLDALDNLQLVSDPGPGTETCPPDACLDHPKIQRIAALPADASGPNLLVTMHAIEVLHLRPVAASWLLTAHGPLDATQINGARQAATAAGMTIETKSDAPSLSQLRNGATGAGIVVALAVLAMTVGLVRGEAGRDLRTLAANGASGRSRRGITAATAGALGLTGALLGTAVGYLATASLFRGELSERMSQVPVLDLVLVIVGLPLVAVVGSWLLAGREPLGIARQPID